MGGGSTYDAVCEAARVAVCVWLCVRLCGRLGGGSTYDAVCEVVWVAACGCVCLRACCGVVCTFVGVPNHTVLACSTADTTRVFCTCAARVHARGAGSNPGAKSDAMLCCPFCFTVVCYECTRWVPTPPVRRAATVTP